MSNPNTEDTTPVNLTPEPAKAGIEDTSPVTLPKAPKKKGKRRWLWILLGLLLLVVAGGAGGYTGYQAAISERIALKNSQTTLLATEQFQLALQDEKNGNYHNALQRIQYVISVDPNYPGAASKLAEIMLAITATAAPRTAVPVDTPTPAFTPTPDTRGEQELFNAARAALAGQDWQLTIDTLDSLRKLNRTFNAVQVDGMYYVSLRNRGMNKIRAGQLEEGMYDMSLTERFGPLDKEADTYRTWSRLYVTGASFWELDWEQVINYFSQIYPAVPMLSDSSGVTATERYRLALIAFADKLVADGDYCRAEEYYKMALDVSPDQGVGRKSTEVYLQCHPPTATPEKLLPTETLETPIGPTETEPGPMPSETPPPPTETPPPPVEPTVGEPTPG